MKAAIIAIGRNEGARFEACLASIKDQDALVIYVDSGSTDGSVEHAKQAGVDVVNLDMSKPFTAARARNTGVKRITELGYQPDYVQFIDGDCVLDASWLEVAQAFVQENPKVAAVCGRLRERFPDATLYNRLVDNEWDRSIGQTDACGGIVLMRADVFEEVSGFNEKMIAGEEPELCFRLRQKGWEIWNIPKEMALHDVAMTRFGQWWKRAKRAGYTYAEGVHMHGDHQEKYNKRQLSRAIIWGMLLPILIVISIVLISPLAIFAVLIWPAQILRLILRGESGLQASFMTIGKFAEAQGALKFWWDKRSGRRSGLIEYK